MREIIVSELVRDILGPRGGPRETLKVSPLHEYLTGILAPVMGPTERDPDAEGEIAGESLPETVGDDTVEEIDFLTPSWFSPVLNPKALPHSVGISFVATGLEGQVRIRVCCTWGRYRREEKFYWKRQPRYFESRPIIVQDEKPIRFSFLGDGTRLSPSSYAEASLYIRGTAVGKDTFHVSIHLMNELSSTNDKPSPEEHLFQPQIRILCEPGTRILPYRAALVSREDQVIAFQYRDQPILARGHMCSAVWRAVDPEQAGSPEIRQRIGFAPFFWSDGEILDSALREKYSSPDVRTEFVPVFQVGFPDMSWRTDWGAPPELDADALSEMWAAKDLERGLTPLATGFHNWIRQLRSRIETLKDEDRDVSRRLLESCEEVHNRISSGISLLKSDEQARLAFCFANKAISLQTSWAGRSQFTWRPFQLAFILMALESCARENSDHRRKCDLLWVPTGAGKTEAYLGLAAFVMALRRRKALTGTGANRTGGGVAVLTRYTLRLLTIQQFRRTLRLITACEYLRVRGLFEGSAVGWRPTSLTSSEDFLWGSTRFSIGLWVGGQVTPNRLTGVWAGRNIPGAIEILKGAKGEGEPAQVLDCPACGAILAVPEKGLSRNVRHNINLIAELRSGTREQLEGVLQGQRDFSAHGVTVRKFSLTHHSVPYYTTISFEIESQKDIRAWNLDEFWRSLTSNLQRNGVELELQAARASRPGYFIVSYTTQQNRQRPRNFELFCPSPSCPLNTTVVWVEGAPNDCGWLDAARSRPELESQRKRFRDLLTKAKFQALEWRQRKIALPDGMVLRAPPAEFCRDIDVGSGDVTLFYVSKRIPIPALTVDEQVYHNPPTIIVSTVDKFARLPFEPRCAGLFGNVDFYHARFGYYRQYAAPYVGGLDADGHPPGAGGGRPLHLAVHPFTSPELIIQDELHLIEGPLGSLVGLAETAISFLASERGGPPKYVASTATISRAETQVRSLFEREVALFPPLGLEENDRFFLRFSPTSPHDDERPGRLYVGILAPGKGPLTPVYRIWSRLLQSTYQLALLHQNLVDPYWTLIGYFNAIRELAGARALYRQDIPARLRGMAGPNRRETPEDRSIELSSRTDSTDLPSILNALDTPFSGNPAQPAAPDALFTTSMFGTGVDVPRLGLMVVHGQPKTTSAYIQSTGRVGRSRGALVVTFYRSTRPRDLSHYEMFCGYHLALHRFVEPVTVAPFSPGAVERLAGPMAVGILRSSPATREYVREESATLITSERQRREVRRLSDVFESRADRQPPERRPEAEWTQRLVESLLDRWRLVAANHSDLRYVEYVEARSPVVLGDPIHQHQGRPVVFRNAPQSLRDVEETTGFET